MWMNRLYRYSRANLLKILKSIILISQPKGSSMIFLPSSRVNGQSGALKLLFVIILAIFRVIYIICII